MSAAACSADAKQQRPIEIHIPGIMNNQLHESSLYGRAAYIPPVFLRRAAALLLATRKSCAAKLL